MAEEDRTLESFVHAVQRRLTRRRWAAAAAWTVLVAAAAMIVVALGYVLQGYAVDWQWYAVLAAVAVVALFVAQALAWVGEDRAAHHADQHFRLADGLLSWLHFSRRGQAEGFYALQRHQTAEKIDGLDPSTIDWRPRAGLTLAAVVLGGVAASLGFVEPSQAVLDRLAIEEATLDQTALMNEDLKKLVRDLNEQAADEEERKLLNPDKLREMVEALEATKDQKDALRQYAKLEKKLRDKMVKLQQRRDEQLLSEAAKELKKDRQTKQLGEKLSQRKYKEAGEELDKMKPDATKKLTEQQKQLARMKAASARMAAAVHNRRTKTAGAGAGKSASSGAGKAGASGKSGSGQGAAGQGGSSGGLDDAILELEEALSKWDDALEEAELQMANDGECDQDCQSECDACRASASDRLSRMTRQLNRMAVRRAVRQKLNKLCDACSQCQGGVCQCQSPNAGGKKAGSGTNTARRDVRDQLVDNGQTTQLKGVKGQGPSQSTVETADDGSGVATRGHRTANRSFERQVEAFVSREDVPEQVKSGVKQYFESIHQGAVEE